MNHKLFYLSLTLVTLTTGAMNGSGHVSGKEMNNFLNTILKYTRNVKELNKNKFNFLKKKMPEALKKRNATLLMIATTGKKERYVKLFLPLSKVNAVSIDGISCLHIVGTTKHLPTLNLLLKKNDIKIDIPDKDGVIPLHVASRHGFTKMVKKLLTKGSNINAVTKNNDTPLMLALAQGHQEIVNFLLTTYPTIININIINKQIVTAFQLATRATKTNSQIIKIMLKMPELDPNVIDLEYGYAPLIKMILEGNNQLATMLINHPNIRINQANGKAGETPLMYSIRTNNLKIFKEILQHSKLNINQQNMNQNTALIYTVLSNNILMMKLILQKEKVDLLIKNKNNETVFDIAKKQKKEKISQLLTEACYFSFFEAIYEKNKEQEQKIAEHLNLKTKINQQNIYNGGTLLMLACYLEATYVVKKLLEEYHANPTISDLTYLNTPLMLASTKGYRPIVKILLKYLQKGKINQVDHHGNTALMMACDAGHIKLVKTLLKSNDIDLYISNKKQLTAIAIVAEKGYIKILDMLLEKSDANHLNQPIQAYTALIAGAMYGHITIVKRLLGYDKIDWDIKGRKHYLYAFLMSQQYKRYEVIDFFRRDIAAKLEPQNIATDNKVNTEELGFYHTVHNNSKKIVSNIIQSVNDTALYTFQQKLALESHPIY